MAEEKKSAQEAVAEKSKGADSIEKLEGLLSRLTETIGRIETSTLDDTERQKLDSSRNIAELTRERDKLTREGREWEKRYKESLVRQLLIEAATTGGAYRAEQVVSLLGDKISWSEDGREPILTLPSKGGQPAAYERGRFVDAVKAFLADNPNLAASGAGGGAGSRPSPAPATTGVTANFSELGRLPELRKMRAQLEEEA